MKIKLDENLSAISAEIITSAGYDVHTVFSENLSGRPDEDIFFQCCKEKRCLITLDLDFSDITCFSHSKCS